MEILREPHPSLNLLLTIDVGNTNCTFGLFDGEKITHQWRIQSNRIKTSDEYGIELEMILNHFCYDRTDIKDVIIGSVVPDLIHRFSAMSKRFLHIDPMVVGDNTKTGVPLRLDNPKEVGADRIVNVVSGFEFYGGPLIIIDIGTAITHDVISERGEYLGGSIAPGIGIASEALFMKTAKLPKIELVYPKSGIGHNTVEAMQTGIVLGFIGLIDRITEQIIKEVQESEGKRPRVIATGGYSSLIAFNSAYVEKVDKDLTLHGLRLIYERTMKARKLEGERKA